MGELTSKGRGLRTILRLKDGVSPTRQTQGDHVLRLFRLGRLFHTYVKNITFDVGRHSRRLGSILLEQHRAVRD